MVWLRVCWLLGVLVVLPQWGCGGSTSHAAQGADAGGSSGTSSTTTASGASGSGGSGDAGSGASGGATTVGSGGSGDAGSGASGGATTVGSGGSGAMPGPTNSVSTTGVPAAGGAGPEVPVADEREREILSPLWTDAGTLQATSGDELLELARDIALARGYANCRCVLSPDATPLDKETMFEDCAAAEAWPHGLGEPEQFRCISELREEVPYLDEQLRCAAAQAIENGSSWLFECTDVGVAPAFEWSSECPDATSFKALEDKCLQAYYCPDGTLNFGSRCDGYPTCLDLSDEFQCFDEVGQDDVLCADGTVVKPMDLCTSTCELPLGPNVCSQDWYYFTCVEGTMIPYSSVCNREPDCPGAEDEAICFR